ncbi:caspase family protein, partial [bacterium]|nr:caspase family protein [bacterium]
FGGIFENLLEGHTNFITSIAFSPDGKYILTGSNDRSARLWNVKTGREIRVFRRHSDFVTSVDFSPDSIHIVTGSLDNSIKLWELKKQRELMTFSELNCIAASVRFSPDGKYILTTSSPDAGKLNRAAVLCEISTGEKIRTFAGSQNDFASVEFTEDGNFIFMSFLDGSSKLWDISTDGKVQIIEGYPNGSIPVSLSLKNKNLISKNPDGTFRIWNIDTGAIQINCKEPHDVSTAVFSPDKKQIATGGLDHTAKLWDCETGDEIRTFVGHTDCVISLAFSSDGMYLITGDCDHDVKFWDVATGNEIRNLKGHLSAVSSVDFSPDNSIFLTGSVDGLTILWDATYYRELVRLTPVGKRDWIITASGGFFDASPGAKEHIHFVRGYETYELNQFAEDFYRPNLLQMIVRRNEDELPSISNERSLEQSPPPSVKIISPTSGERLRQKTIDVKVQITDTGGGIDEIKLLHNGKRIMGETWGVKRDIRRDEDGVLQTFTIPLVTGDNTIHASAFSQGRLESLIDSLDIFLIGGVKNAVAYVLSIGINEYPDASLNPNYARTGASGFAETMRTYGGRYFEDVEIITLYDAEATSQNLMTVLDHLAEVTMPEDLLVFYFAGQSSLINGEFYLATAENSRLNDPRFLERYAVNIQELQERFMLIPVLNQLVVLDACRGNKSADELPLSDPGFEKALDMFARSTGAHILASNSSERRASGFHERGYSAFTFTLLEGLKGSADTSPDDGKITMSELKAYIDIHVPALSEKHNGVRRYPNTISYSQDFQLTSE